MDIANFGKLTKKTKLLEKFELTDMRLFNFLEKRKREREKKKGIPAPMPTPIRKWRVISMVWNISIGQLGSLSGCAPSQLLSTCP